MAEHLLELERMLPSVPSGLEGVIQFRLDHPGEGRVFFSVSLGAAGHRLERIPRFHPEHLLAISGTLEDWLGLYRNPHAERFGDLALWGDVRLLGQLLKPRTKRRSFVDVRASRGEW